jgi:hypothetical protein
MEWLIAGGIVLVLVPLGILAQRKGWIDVTGKNVKGRGGAGAGIMGGVDEVFAPMRYETQRELDRQSSMPAPAPVPGDGDKDIFKSGGKVRIELGSNGAD